MLLSCDLGSCIREGQGKESREVILDPSMKSKPNAQHLLRAFAVEMGVYAVLMAGYFFLVLHFAGNWLKELFDQHRTTYAVVALALIVAQGVLLEAVTTWLLRFLGKRIR
jgi:hypothetical protein